MSSVLSPLLPEPGQRVRWGQLYGASLALALAQAAQHAEAPLLVITADARQADQLEAELGFFLKGSDCAVLQLPDWETLPYDVFSPHQDIISARLRTLYRLPETRRGIVIASAPTLLQRLPPRAYIDGGTLMLARGETLDIEALRMRLERAGYNCVSQVMEHGEYAVRGSLVDIFPMGSETPFRIDLFDEEIETIRSFDPETQISTEQVEAIELLPAREFPLTEEAIRNFRQAYRARFEGDPQRSLIYREVSHGHAPGGIEYYLPLFFAETSALGDYLPAGTVVATLEGADAALDAAWEQIADRFDQRAHDIERPLLAPHEAFLGPDQVRAEIKDHARIDIRRGKHEELVDTAPAVTLDTQAPPSLKLEPRAAEPAAALLEFLTNQSGRTLFMAESTGHREQLLDILSRRGIRPQVVEDWPAFLAASEEICLCVGPLEQGTVLPTAGLRIVVEEQLYGERVRQRRQRAGAARDPEAIIRDLTDLSEGAPVVHQDNGVGRYIGLQTLTIDGMEQEFLTLEYAGGDKLYVPVASLHLISRYTGPSPETAPLHRLGSDQWAKAKRKAAEQVRDVAAELLDIYARREARPGHAFRLDNEDYEAFAASFPFDETADQHQAIETVIDRMTSARSMDLVVCGDVGFGKTEVAVRAAFVAIQGGRQVAVLVPTTLLAQQHFQTFHDRFSELPVRIEALSRFRTGTEQKTIADDLAAGKIDIVVGTHALLRDDIRFKDLGLVIIDEEQRFGVRHKERLKALRAEVDVLTLTATPIPRTLNMALAGLRDLSIIATPPAERLSVKTFVSEWNDALLREAIHREIKRGGQVFFVHNEVKTIERAARRVSELVPEAEVQIAHGQMRERDLERVMLDFYHRRFNVLVCSTIIESGIDIPTANTIIIERADKFGLAQLHQLRGRVGRSHHRAYAYLVIPPRNALTADAVKRLEAIESLEDLGAGFALATHDLEIRGAGELLGDEQSGQIQEIGFTLYREMLERAVKALRAGKTPDLDQPLQSGPEVELRIPALLPADYMPDVHMRLILYKRIAGAESEQTLRDLQVEMIDRFGLLPGPAKMLFRVAQLKLRAGALGIRKLEAGPKGGRILFTPEPAVDPMNIIRLVQTQPHTYRLDGPDRLRFAMDLEDRETRADAIEALLGKLAEGSTPRAGAAGTG